MKKYNLSLFMLFMAALILSGCNNWLVDKFKSHSQEAAALTVTFDKNGGDTEADPKTVTITAGAAVGALPAPPIRMDYTFLGWNTKTDGSGSWFTAETLVNENLTVYAQWYNTPPGMFTVVFDKNNNSPPDPVDVASGNTVSKPVPDPTRTGYTFGGWYTDNGTFAKPYNFSAPVTGNLRLFVKWTGNAYTVIFNKNNVDATGTMTNQSFTYGTAQTLTVNTFDRAGYTFEGWNTQANGTGTDYSDVQSVNNLTAINNEKVTLYAKWVFNPAAFALGGIGPGGGIIFYIDTSQAGFTVEGYGNPGNTGYFPSYTAHYLEAAPEGWYVSAAPNDPQLAWGFGTPASNTLVPGLSENPDEADRALGRGKKNTALILACPGIADPGTEVPAAYACNTYIGPSGKDDWFLPSQDELNQLYQNKNFVPGLDIFASNWYWSSSQLYFDYVRAIKFNDGGFLDGNKNHTGIFVRAIRAF